MPANNPSEATDAYERLNCGEIWNRLSFLHTAEKDDIMRMYVLGLNEFEKAANEIAERAFQEGRLSGLKEMDGAWVYRYLNNMREIEAFRSEYQQPN